MSHSQRNLVNVAIAAGLASAAAACATPAADPLAACADLTTLELIDLRIDAAEPVSAAAGVPAHCKVTGVIETEINFELLLPDDWNGRFLMGGGGGFVGSVQNQARSLYAHGGGPLQRGYATVGTDTGHTGGGIEAGWALNHPERQENFGHRAVHLTAETAKSIVAHYYARPADYSYFVGCSRGGGQAMMESQRYPGDFDGIVAAAPAYDWTGISAGFVQNQQAIYPDGDLEAPVLTPATLDLLGSSILAACDADDGVEDSTLTDPRRCGFTPDDLPRCAGDRPADDCVTAAQLAAIKTVYDGPTSNGEPIYQGFNYGGEHDAGGWDSWVVRSAGRAAQGVPNAQFGFGTETLQELRLQRPRVGLHAVRLFDLEGGCGGHGRDPQRDRHRPEPVPGRRRQDYLLDRVVRSGAGPARHDRLLRTARGGRSDGGRLHAALHAAGCAALRRRPWTRSGRLGRGDSRVGRRGAGARAPDGREARSGWQPDDDASALSVSAGRRLRRDGRPERRGELHLRNPVARWRLYIVPDVRHGLRGLLGRESGQRAVQIDEVAALRADACQAHVVDVEPHRARRAHQHPLMGNA